MSPVRTQPIQTIGDPYRENNPAIPERIFKPTDSKVMGLVLPRISHPANRSALLPTAPQMVMNLLSAALAVPTLEEAQQQQNPELLRDERGPRRNKLRRKVSQLKPVGLRRYDTQGWMNPMNALMQFLLFLPGFVDLFNYAPRSFHYFLDFIEQYLMDQQQENLSVSSANTATLIRCLTKKLPSHLFRTASKANFYEILHALMKALLHPFPASPSHCDCVLAHFERQILWDLKTEQTLEGAMKKKMEGRPSELLIAVKGMEDISCRVVKKQFCTQTDWLCYDLHSFIELRPDGADATFVTYLKTEEGWYQCDDDRITPLLSNSLTIPLHRSVLLYYRRLEFR